MAINVSSVTASGVITVSSTVGFSINQSVRLSGTGFGNLQPDTTYWIIGKSSNTLTLSSSLYGTALITTSSSGSMTIDAYRQLGPGVGNTITAFTTGDYNTIQSIARQVLGAPADATPTFGYNQSLTSGQVAANSKITQAQWENLARDLVYARVHQTGAANEANNLPVPTTTNIVTEAFRKSYLDFANLVLQNANSYALNGQVGASNIGTATRGQVWNGNIASTVTLDFNNIAGARAFFNAGGYISVACSLTGSFGDKSAAKDGTWAGIFGHMGTVTIGPNTTYIQGSSGSNGYTSTPVSKGYFQLTTTNQLLFTETPPSGAYAANTFRIYGKIDATGRYVILTVQFNDDSAVSTPGSSATYGGDEYVDGFLNLYIGCQKAIGSYVTLPPPGVTFTGDLTGVVGSPALYDLQSSVYNINEGGSFTVKVQTLNVNAGVQLYYTVNGFGNTPNGVVRWSATAAYFTILADGTATLDFSIVNDLYTDGATTITIALSNGLASVSVTVNDTSATPTNYLKVESSSTASGPASGQYSAGTFTVPAGIYGVRVYILGGGGGGGNYAGGGGGGGNLTGPLTIPVSPGQRIAVIVGGGGAATGTGGTSYFGAYTSLGGNGGATGNTRSGGSGAQSGGGIAGGAAVSTSAAASKYFFAGGGGGGMPGGTGAAATTDNSTYAYGGVGGNGTTITNFYGNNVFYVGGGGEGGSSAVDGGSTGGSAYGAGQGGGAGQAGSAGIDGTGGGGGGGGVNISGGSAGVNATITGLSGGAGGAGAVWIGWP